MGDISFLTFIVAEKETRTLEKEFKASKQNGNASDEKIKKMDINHYSISTSFFMLMIPFTRLIVWYDQSMGDWFDVKLTRKQVV